MEPLVRHFDAPINRERLHRAELLAKEKGTAVTAICLAWLLHQPMEMFPLIAPTTKEHMRENIRALELSLTEQECRWLLTGAES